MNKLALKNGSVIDFEGPCPVMAVVNCNEDSFYIHGRALNETAVEKALKAEEDGAAIIDFGAESSRPGAEYINTEEELKRLIPVIESFRKFSKLPVSVDTRKAAVAEAAVNAGADIINDISAMEDDPLMFSFCAEKNVPVILVHKKGTPSDMQDFPCYEDAVAEIKNYLLKRAEAAVSCGIKQSMIFLDPGIGFGKRTKDNLALINRLSEIRREDYPVVMGLSRKSFIGEITGRITEERLAGTIAANAAALINGADIIRVHDVKEAVDTAKIIHSIKKAGF